MKPFVAHGWRLKNIITDEGEIVKRVKIDAVVWKFVKRLAKRKKTTPIKILEKMFDENH